MSVTERRPARGTDSGPPASDWSWERTLPITSPSRPAPGPGLRVFPGMTWWTALLITVMFVALVVVI